MAEEPNQVIIPALKPAASGFSGDYQRFSISIMTKICFLSNVPFRREQTEISRQRSASLLLSNDDDVLHLFHIAKDFLHTKEHRLSNPSGHNNLPIDRGLIYGSRGRLHPMPV